MEIYCRKNSYHGIWAYVIDVKGQYYHGNVFSKWVDLTYDNGSDERL